MASFDEEILKRQVKIVKMLYSVSIIFFLATIIFLLGLVYSFMVLNKLDSINLALLVLSLMASTTTYFAAKLRADKTLK